MIPNWFTLNNDTEIQDGISVSSDVKVKTKAEKLLMRNIKNKDETTKSNY